MDRPERMKIWQQLKELLQQLEEKNSVKPMPEQKALSPIAQMGWGDGGVDESGTPKVVTGEETALFQRIDEKRCGRAGLCE